MKPHQQRVIDELFELSDKLQKLMLFMVTPFFASIDSAEQSRLILQASVMSTYELILKDRIEAF